jgi:hypothetical protein
MEPPSGADRRPADFEPSGVDDLPSEPGRSPAHISDQAIVFAPSRAATDGEHTLLFAPPGRQSPGCHREFSCERSFVEVILTSTWGELGERNRDVLEPGFAAETIEYNFLDLLGQPPRLVPATDKASNQRKQR